MKNLFMKTGCLMLAIAMLLTLGACKSTKEVTSEITSTVELNESDIVNSDNTDDTSSKTTKKSTKKSSNTTEVKSELSGIPKSLQGTTITVYTWNNVNDVPGAATLIKKFQKQTKINISWKVGSYDNYKSEIAAMVAAKNSPDVIRLRGVEPGILSLMDPVTATGYDFKEGIWDTFVSNTYTFNGKTYAVNRSNSLLQQPLVMLYNRDLVTKYDLNDPYAVWKQNKSNWNWDTFIDLCNAYKKVAGADAIPWEANGFKDYASCFGGDSIKRNGDRFVNNMSDGNLLKGVQQFEQWRIDGIAGIGWDMNGFNTGKYLFFGPAIISARRTHFDLTDLKAKGSLGAVPYPCVKGQSVYYQNVWEVEAYGIPKGAKNAAAVPYFLKTYLDGDNYDSKSFFNDKTILDVYNYCMHETTLVPEYDRWLFQMDLGGDEYTQFSSELKTASPSGVKTILDKYAPTVERAVNQANNTIAALK